MKKSYLAVALAVAGFATSTCAFAEKPSIGVAEFKNESSAGWWRGGVGWELAGMLSNELSATGAFKVLEREQIRAVLDEQNLAASGRVAAGTGAKIGQLAGAKRRGNRVLQRDDQHSFQWTHGNFFQNERGNPSTCSAT